MKELFRYSFHTYPKDQFLLPVAGWGLFAIVSKLFQEGFRSENTAGAFLGFVLPLLTSILAANVVLNDTNLELNFSTSHPAAGILAGRFGVLMGFSTLLALSFQLFCSLVGINLAKFGTFIQLQGIWFFPCLAAYSVGMIISFALRSSVAGSAFAAFIWLFQLLLRGWFSTDKIAQYFFYFQGMMLSPGSAGLARNQISLGILSVILLLISVLLFKKQEHYL